MTSIMPRSPVLDDRRNARPEWREYLGAIETAIRALEALGLDDGPIEVINALRARVEVLKAKIAALPEKAINRHERLLTWRGTIVNNAGGATFTHDFGTRNIWWQIRNLDAGGAMVAASFDAEVQGLDESGVRLGLGAGTFDAFILGVISDSTP